MPVGSVTEARDGIHALFKAAFDAASFSPTPQLRYMGLQEETPDGDIAWLRISVRHNESVQAAMGGSTSRRFRRYGLVIVEIRTPMADNDGLTQNDNIANVMRDTFEGATAADGAIWFRNARVREIGVDGAWFQTNVLADFMYDEVR